MRETSTLTRFTTSIVLSTVLLSCAADERNIARNVTNYRILSVMTEPPEVRLQDLMMGQAPAIRVSVVDVAPADLATIQARQYTWTVCFSVGAVTKFACLDDQYTLDGSSPDGTFEIPLDIATLTQLLPPDALEQFQSELGRPTVDGLGTEGCPTGAGQSCGMDDDCDAGLRCEDNACMPPPQTSPLPLIIKVRGMLDTGESRVAAKILPLRLYGESNRNPTLSSIRLGNSRLSLDDDHPDTCRVIGPFSLELETVRLAAEPMADAAETYRVYDGDDCRQASEKDDLILAWYTTHGDLKNGLSDGQPFENELTLASTDGPSRLYLVLRDGRGGLDVHCLEFAVESSNETR
ncbi:MAG: hypothetical protein VX589_16250 [Myxococcota bacterium]|nr:hypothetical protein [Myxococcota bacterium]